MRIDRETWLAYVRAALAHDTQMADAMLRACRVTRREAARRLMRRAESDPRFDGLRALYHQECSRFKPSMVDGRRHG